MPDTSLRLIDTLRLIPCAPRYVTTPRLQQLLEAMDYEVNPRMLQRDLERLSTKYGIACDETKPKRWYWPDGAKLLDIPRLDPHAALTFGLVEQHLRALLPASTVSYLAPYFDAARSVLDADGKGLARWREKIRVLARGQPLLAPAIDPAVQRVVYQALLEERRFDALYHPPGARERRRYEVNPLAMVVRDRVIYLVATLSDHDDIRQFALHRMKGATLLDKPAHRPKGFDLDDYIRRGEFGFPQGATLRLSALFDRPAGLPLIETRLSADQETRERSDGRLQIDATVSDTAELRWWLLSFGGEVEVLKPPKLRRELLARLKDAARRYA